jgi:uroporphyrinogen-III decarboxylase
LKYLKDLPPNKFVCARAPQDVNDDVKKLIDIFGDNGGLVIDGTIGIPDDSKPENVQALTDAARQYGVC